MGLSRRSLDRRALASLLLTTAAKMYFFTVAAWRRGTRSKILTKVTPCNSRCEKATKVRSPSTSRSAKRAGSILNGRPWRYLSVLRKNPTLRRQANGKHTECAHTSLARFLSCAKKHFKLLLALFLLGLAVVELASLHPLMAYDLMAHDWMQGFRSCARIEWRCFSSTGQPFPI